MSEQLGYPKPTLTESEYMLFVRASGSMALYDEAYETIADQTHITLWTGHGNTADPFEVVRIELTAVADGQQPAMEDFTPNPGDPPSKMIEGIITRTTSKERTLSDRQYDIGRRVMAVLFPDQRAISIKTDPQAEDIADHVADLKKDFDTQIHSLFWQGYPMQDIMKFTSYAFKWATEQLPHQLNTQNSRSKNQPS